ncbi:MAG: hypothetical protein HY808_06490 [Nitrospirae bacterium]|nr:hypothetical protein [Nitrospirota bacterium]
MKTLIITGKEKVRLEQIDVVRWQDGIIHVLGRGEETVHSDSVSCIAYHIIHDASTGKVISEDSFLHRGSFPLFMCGCYTLACEGDCPPLLDHELALAIHENRMKADIYVKNVVKFTEANLNDLK